MRENWTTTNFTGILATASPTSEGHAEDGARLLRKIVNATAMIGGPLFLVSVILHPARDGHDIALHYNWYETTHAVEAVSLLILAICLAGVLALSVHRFGPRGPWALGTALAGTILWFGLIIFDGSHNPVTARYAPQLVHTSRDLDISGGMIVVTANILFPLGYVLLALLLNQNGARLMGLLLGFGGVTYAIGGTAALFGFGPHSVLTSVFEIIGATPYVLGFVLLGRAFGRPSQPAGQR